MNRSLVSKGLAGVAVAGAAVTGAAQESGSQAAKAHDTLSGSVLQLLQDVGLPPVVDIVLARLILVIGIVVLGWLALAVVKVLIRKVGLRILTARMGAEARPRAVTLTDLFYSIIKYVLIFATFIIALRQAGVNPTPFLGGAAIVGLAVSFGSQGLVQDVVTGIFVMLENQFTIGEYVDLGGKSGVVVGMSIRIVTIRDAQGNLQNIPYRTITTITNSSRSSTPLVLDVFLAEEKDEAAAPGVLEEALKMFSQELSPLVRSYEVIGVMNPGSAFRAVRANVNCLPGRADFVQAEAITRVKRAFTAASIAIAEDRIRCFGKPLEAVGWNPAI